MGVGYTYVYIIMQRLIQTQTETQYTIADKLWACKVLFLSQQSTILSSTYFNTLINSMFPCQQNVGWINSIHRTKHLRV